MASWLKGLVVDNRILSSQTLPMTGAGQSLTAAAAGRSQVEALAECHICNIIWFFAHFPQACPVSRLWENATRRVKTSICLELQHFWRHEFFVQALPCIVAYQWELAVPPDQWDKLCQRLRFALAHWKRAGSAVTVYKLLLLQAEWGPRDRTWCFSYTYIAKYLHKTLDVELEDKMLEWEKYDYRAIQHIRNTSCKHLGLTNLEVIDALMRVASYYRWRYKRLSFRNAFDNHALRKCFCLCKCSDNSVRHCPYHWHVSPIVDDTRRTPRSPIVHTIGIPVPIWPRFNREERSFIGEQKQLRPGSKASL